MSARNLEDAKGWNAMSSDPWFLVSEDNGKSGVYHTGHVFFFPSSSPNDIFLSFKFQ